ncbi:effector-associated constant component EACC1 [Streptomyces sviceus]|uniref:effector-associated constant component EACC1 n=1 Tax=Streptomyces sviceus TaxID=285530 RepID=UPI0033210140
MESRLLIDNSDAGTAAAQLRELAEWLRHERELRGRVHWEHGDIASDEMGGLPEALVIALSSGGAITVLAQAAVEWVKHRTRDVTLKVVREGGESFEVSVQRATSHDEVVAELLAFLRANRQNAEPDETA